MTIRKTNKSKKPASKKVENLPAQEIKAKFSPERRLTISVGTALDYGKSKLAISLTENVKDSVDPMEFADELFDILVKKLNEKFQELCKELDEELDDEPEEDEELTEDSIRKMKKAELVQLIKDEELDEVNPKQKLATLKEAIINALFEDEEDEKNEVGEDEVDDEEDDENWNDEDWNDEE